MAYEVACPSCQARLDIKDDAGGAWLLCPRCLNVVPYPAGAPDAIVAGPGTVPARATRKPPVPRVESETTHSSWQGYVGVLAMTVLAIIGMALMVAHSDFLRNGNSGAILALALVVLVVFLAGLIVYPLGRSQFRSARLASARLGESPGRSRARYFGVILLMLFLFPVALFIIFFTVCTAVLVTAS
jgi:hypothetical protein